MRVATLDARTVQRWCRTFAVLPSDLPAQLAIVDFDVPVDVDSVGGATGNRLRSRRDDERARLRKNHELLRLWGGVTGSARVVAETLRPIWSSSEDQDYADPDVAFPGWLEKA